jgi:amino acid adenylation domain-containing protein
MIAMLHDWFLDSVRRFPAEPALVVDGQTLTYAELEAQSRGVRGLLRRAGGVRPRVGLLATRSAASYATYLATLRSGGVIVPLDASHPPERLGLVARSADLDLIVADAGQRTAFLEERVIALDRGSLRELAGAADDDPDWSGAPADPAYLLFTSGSTGRPKGVPIQHGNLDEFLRYNISRYEVGPGSRMSQTFHLTFDPSVFDMFVAWGGGAALVVPSAEDLFDPVAFVNRHGLTHWYSVPSLISLAAETGLLPPASMPALRWSLFCGEQFTLAQARAWADAAPASTMENVYGPTEVTVTFAAYRLPADRTAWPVTPNGTVPIGRVYRHLQHRIDGDGELQVRGSQRFASYHDPADNEGRFLEPDGADPAATTTPSPDAWYRTGDRVTVHDGELVHLGRLDQQIKLRGYRVELHEIEGALRLWIGVDEAVVQAVTKPDGTLELAAVCTGDVPELRELRAQLQRHLPLHMIPKRVVKVERLPLNDRGKVDRTACAALLRGGLAVAVSS